MILNESDDEKNIIEHDPWSMNRQKTTQVVFGELWLVLGMHPVKRNRIKEHIP